MRIMEKINNRTEEYNEIKEEFHYIINRLNQDGLELLLDKVTNDYDEVEPQYKIEVFPRGWYTKKNENGRDYINTLTYTKRYFDIKFKDLYKRDINEWLIQCLINHVTYRPNHYDDLCKMLDYKYYTLLENRINKKVIVIEYVPRDSHQIIQVRIRNIDTQKVLYDEVFEINSDSLKKISTILDVVVLNIIAEHERKQ